MKSFQLIIIAYLFIATSTLLLSYDLSAQIPDNFEFLEHTTTSNRPGAQKTIDDGIIFVSHELLRTHVLIANSDNTLTVLENCTVPYGSKSKMYEINDSTIQIILYDLLDYDVGRSGIYRYTIVNNQLVSNEYVSYGTFQDTVLGYEITSDGIVFVLTPLSFMRILDDEILERHEHWFPPYLQSITMLNQFNGMYVIGGDNTLYNVGYRGGLGDLRSFQKTVLDIAEYGDNNFVLLFGELRRYGILFQELLNTWAISPEIRSLRQVIPVSYTHLTLPTIYSV